MSAWAPLEAINGQSFNVTFAIHPKTNLTVNQLMVELSGNINNDGTQGSWNDTVNGITISTEDYPINHDYTITHEITNNANYSGIVTGEILLNYTASGQNYDNNYVFVLCPIHPTYYGDLEQQYAALNQSYNGLNSQFNDLSSQYLHLIKNPPVPNTYSMLPFLTATLAIIAAIFIATTIYYAKRKRNSPTTQTSLTNPNQIFLT